MDTVDLTNIPVQYQVYILYFIVGLKLVGELFSTVRKGGGLRHIIFTFWFGENIPKPLADEVKTKASQSKPPFNP